MHRCDSPSWLRARALACVAAGAVAGASPGAASEALASFIEVQISPDAAHLAVLIASGERRALATAQRSDGRHWMLTDPRAQDVTSYFWAADRRLIFTAADANGTVGLYAVDSDGGRLSDLIPGDAGASAPRVVDALVRAPNHALIAQRSQPEAIETLYRVDIVTGQSMPVELPFDGARGWLADASGQLRAAAMAAAPGAPARRLYTRPDSQTPWREITVAALGNRDWTPLALAADDRRIYAASRGDGGDFSLWLLDPDHGGLEPVAPELPMSRVPALLVGPASQALLAIDPGTGPASQHIVDPYWSRLRATVDAALPGSTNRFHALSRDEQFIVVESCRDAADCAFYLLDRAVSRLEFLGTKLNWPPQLHAATPAPPQSRR